MGKLVLINLVEGDFEKGFSLSLQIWTEGDRQWIAATRGKLPPARELLEHYKSWQSSYRSHVSGRYSARITATGATNTTIVANIKKASNQLNSSLNNWLKADYNFSPIREKLFQCLKDESEEIRVIVETDNVDLQRLPWHLWDDFFKHYHRAEVALSLPVKKNQIVSALDHQVKVLAVFGKDTAINLHEDWDMLKKKLNEDTNASVIDEHKPSLDKLCDLIEEHRPQILFFAGHSHSEEAGENGFIDLNDQDTITITDLEPELRKAVKWGLQLAIFNSCDGLGIARQLAQLHVPNIIVMREPVPDEVAQKFLQRFLEAFASGKPLHLAVRRARERINRLESKFPGATWLPMTFQNPAEVPLTWRSLGGIEIKSPSNYNFTGNVELATVNNTQIPWIPTIIPNRSKPKPSPGVKITAINCRNGHENPSENRFCVYCGESLDYISTANNFVLTCSRGHKNKFDNKFCSICGEYLQRALTIITSTDESTSLQPVSTPQTRIITKNTTPPPQIAHEYNTLRNRYKIIRVLGQGGFGKTFIAQDIDLPGDPLCVVKQLKFMHIEPSVMQIARRLFDSEAEIQQKLGNYDQIPRLLAHFEENQEFYLVQEFIEGDDLNQEIVTGKKLSETYVIALLHDILNVLKFVHSHQVVHCDIKPSNLIRRKQDKKLVLIDFGAVKQIINISTSSQANSTIIIGTPGYMAPEQLAGRPSFSSDIYAVGLIAIQALTGIHPLELPRDPATGEFIWQDQAQASNEIAAILNKMVCYDFRQRYQSATEVLQALEDIDRIFPIPTATKLLATNNLKIISRIKSLFRRFKF